MAWIGDELKAFLKTQSAVTALIGAGTSAKIYEVSKEAGIPQRIGRAGRFLTLQWCGGSNFSLLAGEAGFAANRVEVRAYGTSPTDCGALLDKVRLAIRTEGAQAPWGTTPVARVGVETSPESGVVKQSKGGDALRFFLAQDFDVSYLTTTS